MPDTNKKRILKNTILLNIRMVVSLVVSLYTSRVTLDVLGVEDFGIYNVVGGIIVLFVFLNTAMSGATARFITYELGSGTKKSINDIFASAMTIHLGIALIIFILGETIGLYIFESQIQIPENRIFAARIVYQMSILGTLFSIIQIPYNATIIAYEKMDIYAYIEILKVLLRLSVVIILMFLSSDKLILYSILILTVSAIIFLMYFFYCRWKFDTCHFYFIRDKKLLLPMLTFSGWELYGNAAVAVRQQGMNILINNFFGIAMNAAAGIATQASSAVSLFAQNVTMPFRPQVIKEFSQKKFQAMGEILSLELSVCLLLVPMMVVPLYIYMEPVVNLWLKEVPPHAIEFCKISVLINFMGIFTTIFNTCVHATGKIRNLDIIGGSTFLLSFFITYLVYKLGADVMYAYYIWLGLTFATFSIAVILTRSQIKELPLAKIAKEQIRPLICIILASISTFRFSSMFSINILNFIIFTIINTLLICLLALFIWILPVYKVRFLSILRALSDKYLKKIK